ncbi:hypothetical protein GQ457_05G019480 [Hibiscus cannabinus]
MRQQSTHWDTEILMQEVQEQWEESSPMCGAQLEPPDQEHVEEKESAKTSPTNLLREIRMDHVQHPTVMQKVAGQLLSSSLSRDVQGYDGSFMRHALYQRRFGYGNYSNVAMGYPIVHACGATGDLPMVPSTASAICVQAPAEK